MKTVLLIIGLSLALGGLLSVVTLPLLPGYKKTGYPTLLAYVVALVGAVIILISTFLK